MNVIEMRPCDERKPAVSLSLALEEFSRQSSLLPEHHELLTFKSLSDYAEVSVTDDLKNEKESKNAFLSAHFLNQYSADLKEMSGNEYQTQIISPAESTERLSIIKFIHHLSDQIIIEETLGPLYLAEIEIKNNEQYIRLGIIAQNRYVNNGVWKPEQHLLAEKWAKKFEARNIPIVTFIDTPGAEAGAQSNKNNQAHSISLLISTMANLKVPTIGIIWGIGYSGGAIPLATTNALLCVDDGIFSTIQPKGLASIARKQKLDWQTCAQIIGVSSAELFVEGVTDGVIDYNPLNKQHNCDNVKQAIQTTLAEIDHRAIDLIKKMPSISSLYHDEVMQFISQRESVKTKDLSNLRIKSNHSIYGYSFNALRSLKLRSRLKTQSTLLEINNSNGSYNKTKIAINSPKSADVIFSEWLDSSNKLIYEDTLLKLWKKYCEKELHEKDERGYIASIFLGDPKDNVIKAHHELSSELAFYLFNLWQQDSQSNLAKLIVEINKDKQDKNYDCKAINTEDIRIIDIILDERFKPRVINHAKQLIIFDRLYEVILANISDIVSQFSIDQCVSMDLMTSMLALTGLKTDHEINEFGCWLLSIQVSNGFSHFLRVIETWKQTQHPRMSDVIFVVASHFFERLYIEMFEHKHGEKSFSGKFNPVSIGRRKDFWNRLNQAIKDIRIQSILNDIKPANSFTPRALIESIFCDFHELDNRIITKNPKNFPGFDESVIQQLNQSSAASGILTGTAHFKTESNNEQVGLFVSNHAFQAGAFDMSSAERFSRLLNYCGQYALPVVGFICSGGMQTKEGASALFSMPVVNDQINRFVNELGLPIILFGYGDCTGGAQASLMTHPLVDSYYFSGTNMPFAGRIVVPEYLPVTSTLSNYLITKPNSMKGLVKHPMIKDVDERLQDIDASITVAHTSVTEVISNWLDNTEYAQNKNSAAKYNIKKSFTDYQNVLIHARGCTAVKLIRDAHKFGLNVILVQSDPDMDSAAADSLKEGDQLVCLGGYTSDESYLNGESVLRIAELYGAQALHPGIGFLSENSQFAHQCVNNGLNFIGPSFESMEAMGDKSRAIHTALELGVPVVPGSHGLLRNFEHAQSIAQDIGYPIILKAAHGGGGKGIVVIHRAEDLKENFHMIKAEARSSFGSGDIYLERFVTQFRHIEVQLLRDRIGNTRVLGLRDCSVQRNKQKIIEESDSCLLSDYQRGIAQSSACKLANACDYFGAGTVEYIYDLKNDKLYFMEMNTRLQVEHTVTERVSHIDIVQQQFNISMGKSIDKLNIKENGYALEVRINAENISIKKGIINVTPTPGVVSKCLFPEVKNIHNIVAIDSGKSVPPYYDNLIAQVVVHADSREQAITDMQDYISSIIIEGIDTNIPLLQAILSDKVFQSGKYDTSYLEELIERDPESLKHIHLSSQQQPSNFDVLSDIAIEGSNELKVIAPSTGIVYRSSAPDQPSYVKEGDVIEAHQTLCLLEAMKMFHPVSLSNFNQKNSQVYPIDQKYQVTHIKGVTDQQVNRGDLLFVIKPVTVCAEA